MADPQRERAVAAYYDRLAPVYGAGDYARARRAAVLRTVATEIDRAPAVLDLGCGNGAYAVEFAAHPAIALLVGADLSAAMLQAARRRPLARTELVRADATALPFRAARFDLVFMSHVLLLVPDVERCVAEVARSLASGGVLIATVGAAGFPEALQRLLGSEAPLLMQTLSVSSGLPFVSDDKLRAGDAAAAVGLRPEWRSAPFSVSWPAVEEWVRLRWLTLLDDAARARAEHQLARLRPVANERTVEFAETLLVAHQPVTAA